MLIVKPDPTKFLLPEGTIEQAINSPKREYLDLPSLITPNGRVASQWLPTPGELALLNEGIPVTLVVYTFNQPLQPVSVGVGGMDLRY